METSLKLTLTTNDGRTGVSNITNGATLTWDRELDDAVNLAEFVLLRGTGAEAFEITGDAWRHLAGVGDFDELANDAISCGIESALRAQIDVLEVSYAHAECGTAWTDTHSCACDNECPKCGIDIEATSSTMISGLGDDSPASYITVTA